MEMISTFQYIKKLNRQERVVEEVKLAIKPYYGQGKIDKDEYKEIMRKAVPKVNGAKLYIIALNYKWKLPTS